MITEINYLHSKLTKDDAVRIITIKENQSYMIDKTDLLKETETGMLRVVRADGRLFTINPEYILAVCTLPKRSILS